MKKHIYFYGVLVLAYIAYNLFIKTGDERIGTAINILFGSVIFLYISYMAFILIKKMGRGKE